MWLNSQGRELVASHQSPVSGYQSKYKTLLDGKIGSKGGKFGVPNVAVDAVVAVVNVWFLSHLQRYP
jgi:ABC-type glucose/galactose transport system permease subunit